MMLRVGEPTIERGPKPVWVGKRRYGVPSGSRVAHAQGKNLAYVLDPRGRVHALLADGEVFPIPGALASVIVSRYFPESSREDSP